MNNGNNDETNVKMQYKSLKIRIKNLIYENECFREALRGSHKHLLDLNQDRLFLLDRLIPYEGLNRSSSDSEETESSDEDLIRIETPKRKKDMVVSYNSKSGNPGPVLAKQPKRRKSSVIPSKQSQPAMYSNDEVPCGIISDGHMTADEVERHLQSRQTILELERAPLTVPTEMFSNEPSLDSESNDIDGDNISNNVGVEMILE